MSALRGHRPGEPRSHLARLGSRALNRLLDRLSFIIFEQRAPEARLFGWRPGNGGHGGPGGQVPPWVAYNPDWDPKNEIP